MRGATAAAAASKVLTWSLTSDRYWLRGARCRSTSTSLCLRFLRSAFRSRRMPSWICSASTGDSRSTGRSGRRRGRMHPVSRGCDDSPAGRRRRTIRSARRGERPLRREQRPQRHEFRCRRPRPASGYERTALWAGVQQGMPRVMRDLRPEQKSGRRLRLPGDGRQSWRISSGKLRVRRRVAAGRRTGSSIRSRPLSVPSVTSRSGRTSCAISAARTTAAR